MNLSTSSLSGLGMAFPGDLFSPGPWTACTLANLKAAKALGASWVNLPCWYGAKLALGSPTAALTPSLASLSSLATHAGLWCVVTLHLDGLVSAGGDVTRLMWFLAPEEYVQWFTEVCQVLPSNCFIELANEATYSSEDAELHKLDWGSMQGLYAAGGVYDRCAKIARAKGLKVIVPFPLDQSPEQASLLLNSTPNAFPLEAMKDLRADAYSVHLYNRPDDLLFGIRAGLILKLREELGAPIIATEVNPLFQAPATTPVSTVTQWLGQLRNAGVPACWWPWSSHEPGCSWDADRPEVSQAIRNAVSATT